MLGALQRLACHLGCETRLSAGILRVGGENLGTFVSQAGDWVPEGDRVAVRAFYAPAAGDPDAMVAAALTAPPLRVLSVRERYVDFLRLFSDEGAFYALFQPIVDLSTGDTIGHEALLRAQRAGVVIPPGPMFEVAEAARCTLLLDGVGQRAAIRGAAGWLSNELLFINFVPTAIERPEQWLRKIEVLARATGLSMSQLVLEVVESYRVDDLDQLTRLVAHCRSLGCRVALDDVGTGYSSLHVLATISPDVVKLSLELVQALPDHAASRVVQTVTELGHGINARVVAEGIETEAQLNAVRALGVDWGQGWFFGRPERRVVTEERKAPLHLADASVLDALSATQANRPRSEHPPVPESGGCAGGAAVVGS